MAAYAVTTPIPQVFGLDGEPLNGGKLYFGTANANPETSPLTVYWDTALTQPAAQPIGTVNGYPARNGTPAQIFVNSTYSLTVRDKRGRQVLYQPSADAANGLVQFQTDLASTASGKGSKLVAFIQRLTGAVARWVEDKLSETVSVRDFGAVGDGVTDDWAAIEAAIASSNPYRGLLGNFSRRIIFTTDGPCVYFIGQTIKLRNGVILEGESKAATIKWTGNFPAITQTANDVASGSQTYSAFGLRKLHLVGSNGTTNNAGAGLLNGNLSNQHGILLQHSDPFNSPSYSFIEHVDVLFPGGDGILVSKPTVSNAQFGWTQFMTFRHVLVQGCGGYGLRGTGVTGDADFASNLTEHFYVLGPYAGGVKLTGGNDNRLRLLINNVGNCVTAAGTFTNPTPDASLRIDNFISTHIDLHAENNNSGVGIAVGQTTRCYSTAIKGLIYRMPECIKIYQNNGCHINDIIFNFGSVASPIACVTTSVNSQYTYIGRNWYKDTAAVPLLIDASAGGTDAVTGYTIPQATNFGPSGTINGGILSSNGLPIGYATGSGTSVSQATSKATTVTLNTYSGQITTFNDSLAANTTVVFAVNNNKVAVGDTVGINISSGPASPQAYIVRVARVGAGFFVVAIKNDTAGALAETLVLNFTVTKGAIA